MEIRDILKQRRLDLNLTMKELADRIGVSEGTVSRWESGNIANMKRNMVTAYARALDISPSVIMGWDNSELEDGSSAREVFELSDFEKNLLLPSEIAMCKRLYAGCLISILANSACKYI